MNQYIGVTGFTRPEEIESALEAVPRGHRCQLMVGILVSHATLRGKPIRTDRAKRYASPSALASLCTEDERCLNLVHYNGPGDLDSLLGDMIRIDDLGGEYLHGFQINMAWPEIRQLDDYRAGVSGKSYLVLQLGQRAIEEGGGNPMRIAAMLEDYRGAVDAVLYDPSGGKGEPFNPITARQFVSVLTDEGWNVGVAGGLGPNSLDPVKKLWQEFRHISIDAEGKLRNFEDRLDPKKVREYLKRSFRMAA